MSDGAQKAEPQYTGGNEAAQIPVKTFLGWPSQIPPDFEDTQRNRQLEDEVHQDLPFYSPVKKPLFAHFIHTDDVDKAGDWPPAERLPFTSLRYDQIYPSPMRTIQHAVFSALNNSTSLRSEYSLLPYLFIFSIFSNQAVYFKMGLRRFPIL